ncbi:MAG TPA: hydrogenase maturation protease [Thiobacillus sp.]|nr:MAG: hypothetical protein B7Y50_06700 [Hydrogenophilales bacterium 28-61-11]OYZ57684.1 MAG: hypothetical protein B7Y21_06715 [Hydrogenophilales bacterium 16-61-112]OZA49890.1 MAG: hypothetical protein B7X81_02285 [Hydrogenophilales bacterium 17-61-76]HQT30938.1 hydrogenase maturation protease [Thiobacillus sp.]HQT70086.1 hydrogenase maturation protease [Thiobacillus sp.]
MSRLRILGIGSPSGDDQAGWLVVDALAALGVHARNNVVIDKLGRPGVQRLALLENADWVILVDAMQGDGRPGQVQRFDRKDWPACREGLSSHDLGVIDALLLARVLGKLAARLDLYGITIGPENPGQSVHGAVMAAAAQLARRIADELIAPLRQA